MRENVKRSFGNLIDNCMLLFEKFQLFFLLLHLNLLLLETI